MKPKPLGVIVARLGRGQGCVHGGYLEAGVARVQRHARHHGGAVWSEFAFFSLNLFSPPQTQRSWGISGPSDQLGVALAKILRPGGAVVFCNSTTSLKFWC